MNIYSLFSLFPETSPTSVVPTDLKDKFESSLKSISSKERDSILLSSKKTNSENDRKSSATSSVEDTTVHILEDISSSDTYQQSSTPPPIPEQTDIILEDLDM